jgi:outer membrane protein assembly factor BamA
VIDEGLIRKIDVQGGVRSRDSFILREFPLQEGEVFQIDKAQQGITNINSMTLFEYVYLEVSYVSGEPVLTIRLKERPSQLVRFGLRADNERHLQGSLDIRDENFQGTGTELGFTVVGGERNNDLVLEYKARRLFDTYLTFNVSAFYRTLDCYIYGDAPQQGENDWDRLQIGEFQEIRYGGGVSFGSQLERLGKASVELLFQNVRLKNIANAQPLEERHQLGIVRLGTTVDTKDRFSFPTTGVGLTFGYEFALQALGSDQPYNALRLVYDSYSTWGERHTFHPKFTMGFADKTMPFSQQFRFGGVDIFYGLHEDDRRGRELMLLNLEYRYLLPFQLAFDSYVSARYDIGTISTVPEEIKFSTLRHGIGVALAIDTPIGPALFGLGKSFYFSRDLPKNPLQEGPFLFYFSIGYQL